MLARFGRVLLQIEAQRREAVLAVDDEVAASVGSWRLPMSSLLVAAKRRVSAVKSSTVPGIGGWLTGHLVEVPQRPHLGPGKLALESLVRALDAGDELGDFVVLGNGMRRDLLTFAIEPADEPDLVEHVLGRVAGEVKNAVLLPYPRG